MTEKKLDSPSADCPPDLIRKIQAETPRGVPEKPAPSEFEPPVAWLGGRELIANLKLIVLYTLFGGKLDSRDWMTGMVNDLAGGRPLSPGTTKARANPDIYTNVVETSQLADDTTENEFWFDYIADTGDGQMSTYNVAYLAMSALSLDSKTDGPISLPRGEFLFIGGDTAYHVADYETLAKRFQAPFWWAYKDLVCEEKIPEAQMLARRPLFGIPANHDYYDALDGFNRQFRRPISGEDNQSPGSGGSGKDNESMREPLLRLPTFGRHQEASYVALRLPFDWWLWGLDTESDEIDFRQQIFFKNINNEYQPKKLIVATPSPTTVFGKYLGKDEPLANVFETIGLKRPFLKQKNDKDSLKAGECRLDLSGDIHHYARYWGPKPQEAKEKPRDNQNGDRPDDSRYASVVAGGGGAFFDPTNTYFGEVKEQALFPSESESHAAISKEILDFTKIKSGGSIHIIGAVIAFLLCFAATFVLNTGRIVTTGLTPHADSLMSLGMASVVLSLLLVIVANLLLPKLRKAYEEPIQAKEAGDSESTPNNANLKHALLIFLFIVLTGALMGFGFWRFRGYTNVPPLNYSLMVFLAVLWSVSITIFYLQYTELLNEQAKHRHLQNVEFYPTYLMLPASAIFFGLALWLFGKFSLTAYLFAHVVFFTVVTVAGVGIILLALLVGGGLHDRKGKVGYFFIGSWHALLQLTVAVLWTLSIFQLGLSKTAQWALGATLLMVGVYHLFRLLGIRQLHRNSRGKLSATWIAYGLLMIILPVLYMWIWAPHGPINQTLLRGKVWERLAVCVVAAFIGGFMSCVWFGWYLAVTMMFNGHNNEAGGAARLEGYKHFIRVRLRNNDLTAFVIGFDHARPSGKDLIGAKDLRLIDQFTLSVD